ncbi:DUF4062 domain-containing protein [Oryzomonas sagensis]|uniref:DUF4062 domain-containing protein n=1 Tax=Oryzomonas sagensis TaxID=2603857 RepID=A0ABQ6TQ51_9BACT|nr:DUF4062 domain-containing protein [Oryzomonas sagensis]KAB0671138.1 DUF4062 domain-containing protein [Oryzomonas sagensis]
MDRRYQVFLSSTYEDLKEERLEVMKARLELDCFPCGMEYFPAANEDQWAYIRDLIDQCDYYIVVIGGRYGSTDSSGISFTQKEYEYAVSLGVPVIAFVHSAPDTIATGKTDKNALAKAKLDEFKTLVQTQLCKGWSNAHELGAVVSRSLTQLIKRTPRPGWVRADSLASAEASQEILRLRHLVDQQQEKIDHLKLKSPEGAEGLAQGAELFELEFNITLSARARSYNDPDRYIKKQASACHSWDSIYAAFAPYLLVENRENTIKTGIGRMLRDAHQHEILKSQKEYDLGSLAITEKSLQTIIVQFSALGYIELSTSQEERKVVRMAKLTPLGHKYLLTVTAIKTNTDVRKISSTKTSSQPAKHA